ncbi:MAG: glycosyltransferase [Thermodesulfobacteriota bacterium]
MTKILSVGFGITPFVSGGAVLYQESIAKACLAKGFEIICFYAAPRYRLLPKPTPFTQEWEREGIRYVELINPPHHFGHRNDPRRECHDPAIETITEKILDRERPDLVHIHELQLHTASVISAATKRGIPTIKTIHNYYDLCSQRDLMFLEATPCEDFENGVRCVTCLEGLQRNRLHLFYPVRLPLRGTFNSLAETLYRRFPKHYAAQDYHQRRRYFVEQLNKLSCIHCSSRGSAAVLEKYGVRPDRITILPISTVNLQQISPKPLRNEKLPVIFGFMGGPHLHKGYDILIKAFAQLDQQKAKLLIWNTDKREAVPHSGLNIEFRGRYRPTDINQVFAEVDVGLIPSIWQEVFGLTGIEFLAAKIPVIGSNIGGIPQWLTHGRDGFLVAPEDAAHLAEAMDRFVQQPALVAKFQQQLRHPPSFDEHVERLLQIYQALLLSHQARP